VEKRDEFLLKMYEICWANVTKADDAIWKVFAAYTALFAGLAIALNTIGFFGFILLLIAFSLAGMCVSLNANLWFIRNMGLVSNIEKEFLNKGDWNSIMPKKWSKNKASFLSKEIWWIIFFIFPSVIIVTTIAVFSQLIEEQPQQVITVEMIGFVIVGMYVIKSMKTYKSFIRDAPGMNIVD
jgi:hypothetical protein